MPFGGDLISGSIAAAGTWAIGQVAIEYFENGKSLSRSQAAQAFKRFYQRYRESRGNMEELAAPMPALPEPSQS